MPSEVVVVVFNESNKQMWFTVCLSFIKSGHPLVFFLGKYLHQFCLLAPI